MNVPSLFVGFVFFIVPFASDILCLLLTQFSAFGPLQGLCCLVNEICLRFIDDCVPYVSGLDEPLFSLFYWQLHVSLETL